MVVGAWTGGGSTGIGVLRGLGESQFWILAARRREAQETETSAKAGIEEEQKNPTQRVTTGRPPLLLGWHPGHFAPSLSLK